MNPINLIESNSKQQVFWFIWTNRRKRFIRSNRSFDSFESNEPNDSLGINRSFESNESCSWSYIHNWNCKKKFSQNGMKYSETCNWISSGQHDQFKKFLHSDNFKNWCKIGKDFGVCLASVYFKNSQKLYIFSNNSVGSIPKWFSMHLFWYNLEFVSIFNFEIELFKIEWPFDRFIWIDLFFNEPIH